MTEALTVFREHNYELRIKENFTLEVLMKSHGELTDGKLNDIIHVSAKKNSAQPMRKTNSERKIFRFSREKRYWKTK